MKVKFSEFGSALRCFIILIGVFFRRMVHILLDGYVFAYSHSRFQLRVKNSFLRVKHVLGSMLQMTEINRLSVFMILSIAIKGENLAAC